MSTVAAQAKQSDAEIAYELLREMVRALARRQARLDARVLVAANDNLPR
jgi:hypothetical protein